MAGARVEVDAPLVVRDQIEARAAHPDVQDRPLAHQGERSWSYREFRDESVRYSHLIVNRLGRIDASRPAHVAMMLENHLELLGLYGGSAFAEATLFGVITGLRGETLSGVLNQSDARLLVVDEKFLPEIERVQPDLKSIPAENILVLPTQGGEIPAGRNLLECLDSEIGPAGRSLPAPDRNPQPDSNLMVIYTSGTTGLPKGINNNHMKLMLVGIGVSNTLELGMEDVGYTCMPLFHSNSMFIGFMPAFFVGASIAIREWFSASKFLDDVLRHGVTNWNYVGEPVHYVLQAISKKYGGDVERIRAEVTENPRNHMRIAIGNGAAPPDIDRFIEWLGLDDMYELYGSTEAAISTFRNQTTPRGSVGEITDDQVKILSEAGEECPPAELDADGKINNYETAVGEICRIAPETGLFQGYYANAQANSQKYRNGVYHSGDLGHVLVQDGKRYLYFDGRTDDWIRKDGENFSAHQVARLISEHPDIPLAAAYGVPCAVSDELVMVAVKVLDGARLDPQEFFDFLAARVGSGSMDRKWFPDFVRIVDDFEYTQTEKVLVRSLKSVHYDRRRLPDAELWWRRRGDRSFHVFSAEDYESLRGEFENAERVELLDR